MQKIAHGRIILCLVAAALGSLCHADARDLSITVRPVFFDLAVERGVSPLLIEIANKGADARGSVVVVRSQGSTVQHPVDLPRGSRKRFISYVDAAPYYENATATLQTDKGDISLVIRAPEPRAPQSMGLIGGSVGDLTFLRGNTDEYASVSDSYGAPGSLPDRPVGYSVFAGLVLGEGSERMTDDEVAAIKTWVVSGGTLVFTGGASSAVLADSRWKGFLPIGEVSYKTVDSLVGLQALGGSPPPPGRISLSVGKPTPDVTVLLSAGASPIVVRRGIGLGQVVYMAFDPLQPPLKQWKGLQKLFTHGIELSGRVGAAMMSGLSYDEYSYLMEEPNSPFNTTLPGTGIVFLILFAHLILAVPVNLIMLRRIGKGDLAWVTTPIISLAFAAIFFALASGLYGTGQATRTRGVLAASSLHNEGYFMGQAELFIPKGGTYDIGLKDVDSIGGDPNGFYYYDEASPPTEVQDDGQMHMGDLRVPNLAFRSFSLSKRVDTSGWLEGSVRRNPSTGEIVCKFTNNSPYDITNAHLYVGEKKFPMESIEAGATVDTALKERWSPSEYGRWVGTSAALIGEIANMRLGPTIGTESGSVTKLVYVWEDFK